MPCFSPLPAWRHPETGNVLVGSRSERALRYGTLSQSFDVPCGQCIGCRLDQARDWQTRCVHEARYHEANSFITLTYAPEHLPQYGSLRHRDFQLFMKRLRKRSGAKTRYLMAGEYGDKFLRPHYHAILFGLDFPDREYLFTKNGNDHYKSEFLSSAWGMGHVTTCDFSEKTAGYVARYVTKKVTGSMKESHYTRVDPLTLQTFEVEPEYSQSSNGIGRRFVENFYKELYSQDQVVFTDGSTRPIPRYYDKVLSEIDPEKLEMVKNRRISEAAKHAENQTPERLGVRQNCLQARIKKLDRPDPYTELPT